MQLDHYFARTGYTGPAEPTLDTLRTLHRAHMLAIPFENLDIHLGRRIHLTESAIWDKIVTRRRGGFCYEQNGLFSMVLRALGFDVTLIEARVINRSGTAGIPFDHLALVVTLDDRWLVDVGFGENFRTPVRLDDPAVQEAEGTEYRRFRVAHDHTQGMLHRQDTEGTWHPTYQFFLTPRTLDDFLPGCDYHQTAPESSFTQRRLISQALPNGRMTLTDRTLIITRASANDRSLVRDERSVADETQFITLLRTHFWIDWANA